MNEGTSTGSMPANVFENMRPMVTAGFAKLVDEVKKYAAPMYAPTAKGATEPRPERTTPNTTKSSPAVAMISPSQSPPPERVLVDQSTAGSSYMRLASMHPAHAPATCAAMYAPRSRVERPPHTRSARLTTGFRCAPDTEPTARMIATSPAAVAAAFSNSCSPTSPGDSRWAAMPEPTTTATSSMVPRNSARARRGSGASIRSSRGERIAQGGQPLRHGPVPDPTPPLLAGKQSGVVQPCEMV